VHRTSRGLIRPFHSKLAFLNKLFDASWVAVALWIACYSHGGIWGEQYLLAAVIGVGLFSILAERDDLYTSRRGALLYQDLASTASAWLGVVTMLLLAGFATKRSAEYSRVAMFMWFWLAPTLVIAWRMLVRTGLRTLRRQGRNSRTVAIAGAGVLGERILHELQRSAWMGLRAVGFFDDSKAVGSSPIGSTEVKVLGDLDEMVRRAQAGAFDIVYLALPLRAESRVREVIEGLSNATVIVYFVPDIFAFNLLQARLVPLGGIPTIGVFETPFASVAGWVKRVEDIVLASLILLVVGLPMMLIAIGVKMSSKGPVLFRQRRYGLDGREIVVWKFRSMMVCEDGTAIPQAKRADPRFTRFGALLRRTSLDELPQFFNVLGGSMSIVGPRPHAVAHNEQYRRLIPGYMLRHKVKPGITGWAQIHGYRGETDTLDKMERRVEHDLWYICNWSLWLDLRIVLSTTIRGFGGHNTY
jgi:putative colanic acid biosynthesis UDP-glucose lipid carrier transferase